MRGKHNKLGEGERQVRLGQDSFGNKNGNERKLCTLFYPLPNKGPGAGWVFTKFIKIIPSKEGFDERNHIIVLLLLLDVKTSVV